MAGKREEVRLIIIGPDNHYRAQRTRRDADVPIVLLDNKKDAGWVDPEEAPGTWTHYRREFTPDPGDIPITPEPSQPTLTRWSPQHGGIAMEGQGTLLNTDLETTLRFADEKLRNASALRERDNLSRATEQAALADASRENAKGSNMSQHQMVLVMIMGAVVVACIVLAAPTLMETGGGVLSNFSLGGLLDPVSGMFGGGGEAASEVAGEG